MKNSRQQLLGKHFNNLIHKNNLNYFIVFMNGKETLEKITIDFNDFQQDRF